MSKPHVLIAGGGIGGLVAALALLRRGFDVDVYEQAPELLGIGAGIQIAANGTRLLLGLGLGEALAPVVCEAAGKEVRIWNTGETFKLFDLGEDSVRRFGAPYWMVHRGDLHEVLVSAVTAAKPGAIHLGRRCEGFTQDESGVTLAFADGSSARGDVLIGADGVHSRIRERMFQSPKATFTGLMAWRGLAEMGDLPAELQRPVGANWVGPGGHCITYPLRGGSVLNFVGLVERPDWTNESWTELGSVEECHADLAGWHPLVHAIIENMGTPYRWALILREPLDNWTCGRVTLLGDACHPTLPFLAQGAIMAIEDAIVLARCLDAIDDLEAALKRYQGLRMERTAAVVRGSAANTKRFHNPALADPVEAVAYVRRQWAPEEVRKRYDWLFEYDAMSVPLDEPAGREGAAASAASPGAEPATAQQPRAASNAARR